MAQHAVTLNQKSPQGAPQQGLPGAPETPRGDAMKFNYATGARPLDGFTIKRGIGVGGFGEVYYALSDAGKEVALKRVQRHLDIELRGVGQCLNLKHPNLVSLFDIRQDAQGEAWVVMEYVEGESLREALDRCLDGMPPVDVYRWFLGLAAGVAYLHDRGIVHRDLKPGNIFSDEGLVKIGDYGLSKFISCSRRSGQTESVGTFHYMAPEIGRGSYGKQIDIYALGVIIYEMLTGRVPFEGESTHEIIMKHLTADPDLSPVPPTFREVIRKALMKDPEKRFRDVGEMVEAMNAAAASSGIKIDNKAAVARTLPVTPAANSPRAAAAGGHPGRPAGPEVVVAQVIGPAPTRPAAGPAAPVGAQPWENEPIAQTVTAGLRRAMHWMNDSNTSQAMRVVLVLGIALAIFWNAAWLFPVAVALGVAYIVYFAVRLVMLGGLQTTPVPTARAVPGPTARAAPAVPPQAVHGVTVTSVPPAPVPAAPVPVAAAARAAELPKRRIRSSEAVRALLAERAWCDRARELTGSWLVAAMVAAIVSAVILMVGDRSATLSVESATLFAWLWTTVVTGSWAVLTLGKLWENYVGDEVRRRFFMLVAGMAVGFVAWSVHQFLFVPLDPLEPAAIRLPGFAGQFSAAQPQPQIAAYLLFFGFQFLVIRWWRQADALRYTRLSLWDAGVCVLGALIVGRFVPFWSPWGLLIPAAMSLTVQLAAPWIHAGQRARLREQVSAEA
ncbi:MAG: serine/threonine-protein kinase [Pirellulales bacterium]